MVQNDYLCTNNGIWLNWLERPPDTREVDGSSPSIPTWKMKLKRKTAIEPSLRKL